MSSSDEQPTTNGETATAPTTEGTIDKTTDKAASGTTTGDASPQQTRVISAELGEITEIESVCMRCNENGTTRLLITSIPHFREIIVSSFECPHCGEKNNHVEFGGAFGESHVVYELKVESAKDLNRQVVRSEFATLRIPEIEFEIPAKTQPASLNTVEGVLQRAVDGLSELQPLRRVMDPTTAAKIDEIVGRLQTMRTGDETFTMILDDPAGNSYVEAIHDYYHPTLDPQLTKTSRPRTEIDKQLLGLAVEYNQGTRSAQEQKNVDEGRAAGDREEVITLETQCPACGQGGAINMYDCNIPYFKETVIMAFKCDYCGYKSNEVKSDGAVPEKGLKLSLQVKNRSDLPRDVLKSNSATLMIPEIDLEVTAGTLGGFFTSVEGLLDKLRTEFAKLPQARFESGDSAKVNDSIGVNNIKTFIAKIDKLLEGDTPFTLILDDPLANVYIQNPRDHLPPPENEDPQLTKEEYTRTHEQDEDLGLHDMIVGDDHAEVYRKKKEQEEAERAKEEENSGEHDSDETKQEEETTAPAEKNGDNDGETNEEVKERR